jgi:multifunctional beta-oxidation protein
MTETVMPPDLLANLKPDWVVPLVAVLVHKDCEENGAIYEVGGGHMAKLRWERASGLLLKPDDSYTPGAILKRWDEVSNFKNAEYPTGPADFMGLLEKSLELLPSDKGETLDFTGKVVLITGAGAGYVFPLPTSLSKAYLLYFIFKELVVHMP